MKRIVFILLACFSLLSVKGQDVNKIITNWKVYTKGDLVVGQANALVFEFDIEDEWYSYGTGTNCNQDEHFFKPPVNEVGEVVESGVKLKGKVLTPRDAHRFDDDIFGCYYEKVKKHGVYEVPFEVLSKGPVVLKGVFYGQVCKDLCLPFDYKFEFTGTAQEQKIEIPNTVETPKDPIIEINPADPKTADVDEKDSIKETTEDTLAIKETLIKENSGGSCIIPRRPGFEDIQAVPYGTEEKKESLWDHLLFMLFAFVGGLAALLTPCVFPMIPMTVTFFTKQSENKSKGYSLALLYGLFIILIYTLSGTVLAKTLGATGANAISTHWIPNSIFFVIFVVFALSFLGLFEITLPSSWVNSSDKQADKGGVFGAFFMALTLVLVSFSCTGPIVGSILIESADGSWVRPIAGMLGFSLAFALPFSIFALFPSALQKMPKSGGWLNVVKVVLGLVELALALKFLSQVDLVLGWGLLDREVFLALWITIFTIVGLYLLGKVKMTSDDDNNKVGVFRMVFAIASLAFVVYLTPGLVGAPLKAMSGLLPPMHTQDFVLGNQADADNEICTDKPMYAESLHWPHGIEGYFDLREAICCAVEQDKPIFVDFTGHTCANCRLMEMNVWSERKVLKAISQDYVPLALYGDDRRVKLPVEEQYVSDGDTVKLLGRYNADFIAERFKLAGQPRYVLLEVDKVALAKGEIILRELVPNRSYDTDVDAYVDFLAAGLDAYNK